MHRELGGITLSAGEKFVGKFSDRISANNPNAVVGVRGCPECKKRAADQSLWFKIITLLITLLFSASTHAVVGVTGFR